MIFMKIYFMFLVLKVDIILKKDRAVNLFYTQFGFF
jgi:hypothetical protein